MKSIFCVIAVLVASCVTVPDKNIKEIPDDAPRYTIERTARKEAGKVVWCYYALSSKTKEMVALSCFNEYPIKLGEKDAGSDVK